MKKVLKWLLLILWMSIIFIFSNQANSGDITHNVIEEVFYNIQPAWIIDFLNFTIRKIAHITEYLILFFLVISLLKEYNIKERKKLLMGIIFCFVYAVLDEYHQSLVPGRTSTFKDVLIDMIGVLIGYIIFISKLKKHKNNF